MRLIDTSTCPAKAYPNSIEEGIAFISPRDRDDLKCDFKAQQAGHSSRGTYAVWRVALQQYHQMLSITGSKTFIAALSVAVACHMCRRAGSSK